MLELISVMSSPKIVMRALTSLVGGRCAMIRRKYRSAQSLTPRMRSCVARAHMVLAQVSITTEISYIMRWNTVAEDI